MAAAEATASFAASRASRASLKLCCAWSNCACEMALTFVSLVARASSLVWNFSASSARLSWFAAAR
ncbi:MAG: hypothetical protein WDN72_08475 [Alphaproteobacteria bacterium]